MTLLASVALMEPIFSTLLTGAIISKNIIMKMIFLGLSIGSFFYGYMIFPTY